MVERKVLRRRAAPKDRSHGPSCRFGQRLHQGKGFLLKELSSNPGSNPINGSQACSDKLVNTSVLTSLIVTIEVKFNAC